MIGPARENDGARVSVLAPSPLLTVTLEGTDGPGDAEVHLHPGGQGFWIARLIGELGVDVVLCATFGGEPVGSYAACSRGSRCGCGWCRPLA